MEISIKELSINQFEISINSSVKTIHKVTVTEEVYQNLTLGKISKEELLDFSFKFLLEREPNTSILSSFEIMAISRYFPEYIKSVKDWCDK